MLRVPLLSSAASKGKPVYLMGFAFDQGTSPCTEVPAPTNRGPSRTVPTSVLLVSSYAALLLKLSRISVAISDLDHSLARIEL